jgi:hypothetical protein
VARQSSPYLRGGVRSKGGIDVPCQGASIKPFTNRCTEEGFAQRRNRRALLDMLPALALNPLTLLISAVFFSNMHLGYPTPKSGITALHKLERPAVGSLSNSSTPAFWLDYEPHVICHRFRVEAPVQGLQPRLG